LAANRALCYLKETVDLGITYVSDPSLLSPIFSGLNVLVAYADADFGGDLDTSKSMTGYVILMNNGPIAWKSARQPTVTLATSAAETVSMAKATVMSNHLRMMAFDLGFPQHDPTAMHVDNRTAITVGEGKEVMHQTAKHVTVQCRYLTECVQLGLIVLIYVPTHEQRADIFTKALSGTLFRYHRDSLMMKVGSVYERAMTAVKMADVPPTVRIVKLAASLIRSRVMLAEALWYLFLVALIPSRSYQLSMCKDRVQRLVRLVAMTTKRILRKNGSV
jgi:hypothetical protein